MEASNHAPLGSIGRPQVIPNRGAHEQIHPTDEQIKSLVVLGLIKYEPEYGPGARVYRPTKPADADKVRSWLA